MTSRRTFLRGALALTGIALESGSCSLQANSADKTLHIATNQYPWLTFYGRSKRDWNADPGKALEEVASAGLQGIEPLASSATQIKQLVPLAKKHALEMRSLYVNSKLHDAADADASIKQVLDLAEAAQELKTRIIVTNPSPIKWGGQEAKSDAQLTLQASNLDRLGAELNRRGLTLAYHNHDAEMRHSAREFHHMMLGTDPKNVKLCLDAHWIFRGSGDSQVCLFDIVKLHGSRIVELHLRQSKQGIWTESFGEGDIDYSRLVKMLLELKLRPHVVLEQAIEAKSPSTLNAVEAHRQGVKYTAQVFAALA